MNARLLVLVDGSSYLFRAFHALPPLISSKGEPTGAVLGVLNMLYKLVDDYEPEHIAVVFDAPGKTFRDDLYAKYKANRPPIPDELRLQFEPLTEAVEAIGFPVLSVRGVEADDVIGTLAKRATQSGLSTLISTSDKDMAQLVNEHVTLVNTMSGTTMDPSGVRKKFGVSPSQIVDYLALVGDTSDNIPGVPGVGPKTASKWLTEYTALDNLKSHADEIKGKAGEKLRATLEDLPLYQELATIRCDVKLPMDLSELKFRVPDKVKLRSLYERLELKTLLRRIDDGENNSENPVSKNVLGERNYETVLTEKQLDRWFKRIQSAELVALDTETTSLNYMEARLVGISLSVTPGEAAYIPLDHVYSGAPEQLNREAVLEKFTPWLESNALKVGHHLKYDAHIFRNHGIELKGIAYDSMLESYVLNSTATRHDMDSVAQKYLGTRTTKYEEIAGRGAKQLRFNEIDIETASHYAAEDADITLRLHRILWPKLEATPALAKLYQEI
ncbi:MAG: 5'-3' exonuclease H3TH domain-containing protein, partial [Gammaproteobacteria bacterium]